MYRMQPSNRDVDPIRRTPLPLLFYVPYLAISVVSRPSSTLFRMGSLVTLYIWRPRQPRVGVTECWMEAL